MALSWVFTDHATYINVKRTIDGILNQWDINKQLIDLRFVEPEVFFRYSMPENLNLQKEFTVDYTLVNGFSCTSASDLYDALLEMTRSFAYGLEITAGDFTGSDYQNDRLIGLNPPAQFLLFTNEGSGTLQKVPDFTFDSVTGTITVPAGNYVILFY